MEGTDFDNMIEKFMKDNIEQFEDFDPEHMEFFKPIFMIGPCTVDANEPKTVDN